MWYYFFISLFIYLGYRGGNIHFSRSFLRIFITLCFASIFILFLPAFDIIGFEDLDQRTQFFTKFEDDNLSARFYRWILAVEMLSNSLFGYGFSFEFGIDKNNN